MSGILSLVLKMISTAAAKKLAMATVEVVVKRTDNKWDNQILDVIKEAEIMDK